jgi:hypothetical protein
MKQLFLLLLLSVFFSSCEKDDICDTNTPTTPKIVIEFYDVANPTTLKNVTNLGVIAPGFTSGFGFTATSKIKVPLKTFEDSSVLYFIQNGSIDPTTDDNLDEITFNYNRKTVFVSRACGYKTLFTLNSTNPITVTPDSNNWIQNVIVSQPNIENEDETHIKIYF